MSYHIKIERVPYEEHYHLQLVWDVSNGKIGKLFREFSKLERDFLVWTESDNFVGDKYEYA